MVIASFSVFEIRSKFILSPRYCAVRWVSDSTGEKVMVSGGQSMEGHLIGVLVLPLLAIWFGESQLTSPLPPVPSLGSDDNNNTYLLELLRDFNEIMQVSMYQKVVQCHVSANDGVTRLSGIQT